MNKKLYTIVISVIVALGGFLLGFDSALISGVVPFIRDYFDLTPIVLGWSVSAVLLGSLGGMLMVGFFSNLLGRKKTLIITAALFTISALTSAIAVEFWFFIIARIIGGVGIGMAIVVAPVYIAEIAPPEKRGMLVSINQLNIVIGISLSFFSNRYIYNNVDHDTAWRWMLGVETIPALLYLISLFTVPESPRWLFLKGKKEQAKKNMLKTGGEEYVRKGMEEITESLQNKSLTVKETIKSIFTGKMKYFITIGVVLGMLQQFTGINSIFYYAPEIFEKAGFSRDASLVQAIIIGLTNLAFTIVAMLFIDNFGRRKLLLLGAIGMALAHFVIGTTFKTAEYQVSDAVYAEFQQNEKITSETLAKFEQIKGVTYGSRGAFLATLKQDLTTAELDDYKLDLLKKSVQLPGIVVLIAILIFIASFAISIGPVMWVILSEIFPNHLRGFAISIAGFFNGAISFLVTFLFPWLLDTIGEGNTFYFFTAFMVGTYFFVKKFIPETKGVSLEQLEKRFLKD